MQLFPKIPVLAEWAKSGKFAVLPVSLEVPADTLTPVNAFLRLRASGSRETFLLESADGGEEVGRYSFLGIDPFATLTSLGGRLTFHNQETGEQEEQATDFQTIGRYLQRYRTPSVEGLPPFLGAAIGYFSYDCVQYLEAIPPPPTSYGSYELHFKFFKTILIFDRLRHRLHLVQLVNSAAEGLENAYKQAESRLLLLKERLEAIANDEILDLSFPELAQVPPVEAESAMGRDKYLDAVKIIKNHIRRGDIFQCVLSDRFRFPVSVDSFLIYRILRMINPSPYLYYLGFGAEVLLGSSPEMLVRVQDSELETCPIAGTRPRGKNSLEDQKMERDLLASVKERAEHLMLVDLGRNDIGRVSKAGTVRVKSFMQVERYSHVMHLVSRVGGALKPNLTPWDALGSCFPAGTLSGAPKIKAMEILGRLENSQRGPYGGAIVCQDFSGNLNTCITIRSLYLKDGYGYAQAGAGIVADSKPEAEYEEVLNKAKAVRTAVAAATHATRGRS